MTRLLGMVLQLKTRHIMFSVVHSGTAWNPHACTDTRSSCLGVCDRSVWAAVCVLQWDGDRRAARHIRQHAGRFALPAGGSVSLCGREQPQKTGVRLWEATGERTHHIPSTLDHTSSDDHSCFSSRMTNTTSVGENQRIKQPVHLHFVWKWCE